MRIMVMRSSGNQRFGADLPRCRARLGERTRARKLSPHVRARGLGTTGFARNPVLFFSLPLFFCSFPFPFSLKGVKGEVLFSPSLFFDFADGDPPPVDNSSVFIGFSFRFFVVCVSPAVTRPRGKFPLLPSGQNQTKKDLPAPSQKVLKRHKKRRIDYRCAIAI